MIYEVFFRNNENARVGTIGSRILEEINVQINAVLYALFDELVSALARSVLPSL